MYFNVIGILIVLCIILLFFFLECAELILKAEFYP